MATVQLGEICEKLNLSNRDVRYVLERGFVPDGIDRKPASGNHRQFSPGQAFWLVMVLKLKAVGIKTPVAADIADRAKEMSRAVTQSLNWEWTFDPWFGKFKTQNRHSVEVGDLTLIRYVTDAKPGGGLEVSPWVTLGRRRFEVKDAEPFVIIQLDLSQIARHLAGVFESQIVSEAT